MQRLERVSLIEWLWVNSMHKRNMFLNGCFDLGSHRFLRKSLVLFGVLSKKNSCMSKNLWRQVCLNLLFASPCAFSIFVYFLFEDKDSTGKFSRGPPTRKSLVHNWLTNSKRRSREIPGVSNPKEIPPVAELNQHGLPFVDITIRSPFVSSLLLIAEILRQLILRRLDPHISWCFNINRWSQHFIQPPFILLEQFRAFVEMSGTLAKTNSSVRKT